jgi:hypothetical protein
MQSPNRQVGDRSFQPTSRAVATSSNPPTGRLVIVHSNLHREPSRLPRIPQPAGRSFQPTHSRSIDVPEIPQPAGWGSFIPAYTQPQRRPSRIPQPAGWGSFIPAYIGSRRFLNPPTGSLGIVHSNLHRKPPPSRIPRAGRPGIVHSGLYAATTGLSYSAASV